jgi:hypothetical protein
VSRLKYLFCCNNLKLAISLKSLFFLFSAHPVMPPKQKFREGDLVIGTKKTFAGRRGVIAVIVTERHQTGFRMPFDGEAPILMYGRSLRKEGENMGPAVAAVDVALERLQEAQPQLAAAIQGPGRSSDEEGELEEDWDEDLDLGEVE